MSAIHDKYNELFRASSDNNFDKTELYRLITEQNINDPDESGQTLLHLAAARGDKELVKFLTDNNASVTQLDGGVWSALRCAVEAITEVNFKIQDEIIKALLHKGANINETEKGINYSLLHNAVTENNLIKVQILIANGADVMARTLEGLTARQLADRCSPEVKTQMFGLFDTPIATLSNLMARHLLYSLNNASTASSEQAGLNPLTLDTDNSSTQGNEYLQSPKKP